MSLHVVIPTFRPDGELLRRAVSSALACQGVERVTVVDDGSEPPVSLEPWDDRFEVVRRPNGGPSAARNAGLERVNAAWAILLDDDDELLPSGVSAMVGLATRLNAAGAVCARVERTEAGEERVRAVPEEWEGGELPTPGDAFRPITLFNASGTLVSREAIAGGLRYDESLRIGEDREFVRRLAEAGPVGVSGEPAVRAGVRPGGERLTSARHYERRAADHLRIMERWLDGASEGHFREGTRWLLNAMSRSGATESDAYRRLLALARERGWLGARMELKLGLRRAVRRAKGSA